MTDPCQSIDNGLPFAAKYVEFPEDAVPDASLRIGGDLNTKNVEILSRLVS